MHRARRARKLITAASAAAAAILSVQVSQATTYTYTSTNNNTAGTADSWQAHTNWDQNGPVSGTDTVLQLNVPTVVSAIRWTNNDMGTFTLNSMSLQGTGPATGTASLNITGSALDFQVSSASVNPTLALTANKGASASVAVTVYNNVTLDNSLTVTGGGTGAFLFNGDWSGNGGLIKGSTSTDTAVMILNGNNTWLGGTTVNFGTLQIGNGGTTGTISGNIVTNTSPGISFNRSDTYTYSGAISGTGRVQQNGAGTLILTGANSFASFLQLNKGTLQGSDSTAYSGNATVTSVFGLSTAVMTLASGTTLQLRANGQNDSSSQTLSFKNGMQDSTTGSITIDVDRQGGTGTNKTLAMGNLSISINNIVNVTGNDGYSLALGNIGIGGGATAGSLTIAPSTASVSITGFGGGSNTTGPSAVLAGTIAGNFVTSTIADNGTGSTSLQKINTSTWTLQGNNTYSGGTSVAGGTLLINNAAGSGVGKGNVAIVGGTLGGTGTIGVTGTTGDASNVVMSAAGGHLAPGSGGAGTLTVNGNVTLNAAGSFDVDINGTSAVQYDQLVVNSVSPTSGTGDSANGDVALGGATLTLAMGFSPTSTDIGSTYTILNTTNATGVLSGQFAQGSSITVNGDVFGINYAGGTDNNDVVLTLTAVPEPGSLTLLGAGGAFLLGRRRRTKHRLSPTC